MAGKATYSVIYTNETIDGQAVKMFGVLATDGNKFISVKSLSDDKTRVEDLVLKLNEAGLEIEQLLEVVDDFMFSNYGFIIP